ncbi:MAG: DUF366 family protein [Bdellovibrionales bacterium]|nr:DUF366 family protein [Bdellovibrionales bacterium]NQZ19323.1 DUF366 family protein [Bdellovibrionales bacterium]
MMTLWVSKEISYDGSQLEPLSNYLKHGVLGDSIVSWVGPCNVSFEHMMDGEDLLEQSFIESDKMLHFVMELFNYPLAAAIGFQRLMGEVLIEHLKDHGDGSKASKIKRQGDDLYWEAKKLNVSIATCSVNSSLIHFGVNVGNEGPPVPTCALSDFGITDVEKFTVSLMDKLKEEFLHQKRAAVKVRHF